MKTFKDLIDLVRQSSKPNALEAVYSISIQNDEMAKKLQELYDDDQIHKFGVNVFSARSEIKVGNDFTYYAVPLPPFGIIFKNEEHYLNFHLSRLPHFPTLPFPFFIENENWFSLENEPKSALLIKAEMFKSFMANVMNYSHYVDHFQRKILFITSKTSLVNYDLQSLSRLKHIAINDILEQYAELLFAWEKFFEKMAEVKLESTFIKVMFGNAIHSCSPKNILDLLDNTQQIHQAFYDQMDLFSNRGFLGVLNNTYFGNEK